jgi:flagellar export protein FliJ
MFNNPTRDRWSLLTYKAQQKVNSLQESLAAAQQQLEQLKSSELKLTDLLIEYQEQHTKNTSQSHLVIDAMNQRQFMTQLTQLIDHARQRVGAAHGQVAQLRKALVTAQLELSKCEKLEAHARAQERVQEQRREQRIMDDLAITRHHWRQV